ncbi:MAG: hypothetical protein EOP62_14195 [Sphingomonadales bacterium]|nr:MAG: hypothetical protein EOP62_14195 [Sphingomonadales bacterium]
MFALEAGNRSEFLLERRFHVDPVHVGNCHVSKSPEIRSENSVKMSRPGRQAAKTENSVGLRILEAMGPKTRSWLAQQSGLPESTIGDAIQNGPKKTDVAIRIAEALNVSLEWLLFGRQEAATVPGEEIRKWLSGGAGAKTAPSDLDLVAVNDVEFAYGLGGTYSDGDIQAEPKFFPRSWIESITRTPPSQLAWTRGLGDSMAPTINNGDLILIDLSAKTVREEDAFWALTIGDIAMIKRLRIRKDRVLLYSDNDRVESDDVFHEEVNIVGRVVFIGKRV